MEVFCDNSEILTKACRSCDEVKPYSFYHRHKANKTGYDSICKVCSKAKTYEYRKNNPDVHRRIVAASRARNPEATKAARQKWHDKNPEYELARYKRRRQDLAQVEKMRAANQRRKARNRIATPIEDTLTTAQTLWLRAQCCAYCMAPSTELDHVVPISGGGANSIDNIVSACRRCNAQKGAKSLLQFLLARKLAKQGGGVWR
jgi:5-methylcytosine-specific restriction endonuclease McrA